MDMGQNAIQNVRNRPYQDYGPVMRGTIAFKIQAQTFVGSQYEQLRLRTGTQTIICDYTTIVQGAWFSAIPTLQTAQRTPDFFYDNIASCPFTVEFRRNSILGSDPSGFSPIVFMNTEEGRMNELMLLLHKAMTQPEVEHITPAYNANINSGVGSVNDSLKIRFSLLYTQQGDFYNSAVTQFDMRIMIRDYVNYTLAVGNKDYFQVLKKTENGPFEIVMDKQPIVQNEELLIWIQSVSKDFMFPQQNGPYAYYITFYTGLNGSQGSTVFPMTDITQIMSSAIQLAILGQSNFSMSQDQEVIVPAGINASMTLNITSKCTRHPGLFDVTTTTPDKPNFQFFVGCDYIQSDNTLQTYMQNVMFSTSNSSKQFVIGQLVPLSNTYWQRLVFDGTGLDRNACYVSEAGSLYFGTSYGIRYSFFTFDGQSRMHFSNEFVPYWTIADLFQITEAAKVSPNVLKKAYINVQPTQIPGNNGRLRLAIACLFSQGQIIVDDPSDFIIQQNDAIEEGIAILKGRHLGKNRISPQYAVNGQLPNFYELDDDRYDFSETLRNGLFIVNKYSLNMIEPDEIINRMKFDKLIKKYYDETSFINKLADGMPSSMTRAEKDNAYDALAGFSRVPKESFRVSKPAILSRIEFDDIAAKRYELLFPQSSKMNQERSQPSHNPRGAA